LRACSRVGPLAKMCPNCESANSWMPPLAPMEKYPQVEGEDWKRTRSILPEVGRKASSGFSAVMRAAMTWQSGYLYSSSRKSILVSPSGSRP